MPNPNLLDLWKTEKQKDPQLTLDRFLLEHGNDTPEEEISSFLSAANNFPPLNEQSTVAGRSPQAGPADETDVSPTIAPSGLTAGSEPIAGYTIVRLLGRGGFGEVWEALAPGGIPVALKFVTLDAQGTSVEQRSLDIMKNVRHAHLLSMSGAWQNESQLILLYELADQTLLDRFEEATAAGDKGIPSNELLDYMSDAAKGLDYLNNPDASGRPGIQHRDIKPQNIFLVGGSVKVGDFGLVRPVQNAATKHTGAHTWSYAPPEFIEQQTVTRQSDQYSLAVTYCYLRGGKLPHDGSILDIVLGHCSREPDLTMIPANERPVLQRALSKKSEDRWNSCGDFVRALHDSVKHPNANDLPPLQEADSPYPAVNPSNQAEQQETAPFSSTQRADPTSPESNTFSGPTSSEQASHPEVTAPPMVAAPSIGQSSQAPHVTNKSSSKLLIWAIVIGGLFLCMVVAVPVLIALLLPAVQQAREAARHMSCKNNLKQIGTALMIYHETYNTLPPAYIPDANGKPMHSWRTMLLPFLGSDQIYDRYDSNYPWDSPRNQAVVMNSPIELYHCPSDLSGDSTGTNYLMVTRPGTAADGARALRFRDFTDGDSRTIIVVEVTGMNVHWAEPRDISVAELKRLVESRGASGHIAGTFNVLCANGAVHTLGPKSLHLLDALTTINGGEQVDFPANK